LLYEYDLILSIPVLPYQDLKGSISTDARPKKLSNIQNGSNFNQTYARATILCRCVVKLNGVPRSLSM